MTTNILDSTAGEDLNIVKKFNEYDYSYLRPPIDVGKIIHSEEFCHKLVGLEHVRKVFFDGRRTKFELEQLRKWKKEVKRRGYKLPEYWSDDVDIFKVIYSMNYRVGKNYVNAFNKLAKILEWENDPLSLVLDIDSAMVLKQGVIFMYGRDLMYRPIFYFDVKKALLLGVTKEAVGKAICYLLTVIKNSLTKYHVEQWILILNI